MADNTERVSYLFSDIVDQFVMNAIQEQRVVVTTRYTAKEVSHILDTSVTDSTTSTDSESSSSSDSDFDLSDPEALIVKERDTFAKVVALDNQGTDEFVSGTIFESLSDTTAGTSMMGRQTNRDVEESDHESETSLVRDPSKRVEFSNATAGTSMTSDESRKTNGGNEEVSHECETSVVRDPSRGARIGRARSRNIRASRGQRK